MTDDNVDSNLHCEDGEDQSQRHDGAQLFRLMAWNCNMALHRKLDALAPFDPDIAVLAEVAHPDVVASKAPRFDTSTVVWDGKNQHKGLGVVAKKGWSLHIDDSYDPHNAVVIPVRVSGPINFNLLAVWALHVDGKRTTRKIGGPVIRAIEAAQEFCRDGPLVVAGDFNNSVIWDKPGNVNNMAAIDEIFRDFGLVSTYHHSRQVSLGEERDPTLFWRDRRIDGPRYHIDYVYIPEAWTTSGYSLEIGKFDDWTGCGLSDHVPLSLTVPLPRAEHARQPDVDRQAVYAT